MSTLLHTNAEMETFYQHYLNTLPTNYDYHPSNYAEDIRFYYKYVYNNLSRINDKIEETA